MMTSRLSNKRVKLTAPLQMGAWLAIHLLNIAFRESLPTGLAEPTDSPYLYVSFTSGTPSEI